MFGIYRCFANGLQDQSGFVNVSFMIIDYSKWKTFAWFSHLLVLRTGEKKFVAYKILVIKKNTNAAKFAMIPSYNFENEFIGLTVD